MIWSKYSYLFQEGDRFYLYNSLSNSAKELDRDSYTLLCKQSEKKNDINISDEGLKEILMKMKVIVDNDHDAFLRFKYRTLLRRFANTHLSLTINPTLDCNFACPYCFEGKHPQVYMSDQVEEDVVSFVKRHEMVKSLNVVWFGGEPLLAFNRMKSLTQKFLNMDLVYEAGMITNGYLLTDRVIDHLTDMKIKSIQVTVDGLKDLRAENRPGLHGGGVPPPGVERDAGGAGGPAAPQRHPPVRRGPAAGRHGRPAGGLFPLRLGHRLRGAGPEPGGAGPVRQNRADSHVPPLRVAERGHCGGGAAVGKLAVNGRRGLPWRR